MADIKTVGIIGSGTMGQGIAHAVAIAGYKVILYDVNDSVLDQGLNKIISNLEKGIEKGKLTAKQKKAALSNIHTTTELRTVLADLIIEAVVEDLQIKREIFCNLQEINGDQTILVSNTSSIPISQIGVSMKYPGRLAGLHFFNPAHIMKLVEVIKAEKTDQKTIDTLATFTATLGKTPVSAADSPGFIVNRVARHFYVESLKILEDQVTNYKTVDDLLENFGFRMGPFRLMDLIGVDTNFAVTKSIYELFDQHPKFKPSPIQQAKVEAGHLGKKSGKGFYEYG
jgi:3-hydroxybutyryl-CoA dehydrogenase